MCIPLCMAPKFLNLREAESVCFPDTAKMEGEDKSVLFGFHRFDPEINCQGLDDTHNINHRLNVIMRAGQVVKRGLQVSVTASYLKVWSQETKYQPEGYVACLLLTGQQTRAPSRRRRRARQVEGSGLRI